MLIASNINIKKQKQIKQKLFTNNKDKKHRKNLENFKRKKKSCQKKLSLKLQMPIKTFALKHK